MVLINEEVETIEEDDPVEEDEEIQEEQEIMYIVNYEDTGEVHETMIMQNWFIIALLIIIAFMGRRSNVFRNA